jgi:hypothetical protein
MKRCSRCGEIKPYSEFHKNTARKDGLQTYRKSCRRVIDHERYERRRGKPIAWRVFDRTLRKWLRELKTGRPCTDCGRIYPPEVMQWDHLPGTEKLADVSLIRSREAVFAEIAKCELVCTNCHAIRTFRRAGWGSWSTETRSSVPDASFPNEEAVI